MDTWPLFIIMLCCGMHSFISASRDDFKTLLREVRHNNKDSLSGVSMDFIVQQVKQLIDQREKSAPQTANKMGVNRGRGRYVERNSQPERKPGKVI